MQPDGHHVVPLAAQHQVAAVRQRPHDLLAITRRRDRIELAGQQQHGPVAVDRLVEVRRALVRCGQLSHCGAERRNECVAQQRVAIGRIAPAAARASSLQVTESSSPSAICSPTRSRAWRPGP